MKQVYNLLSGTNKKPKITDVSPFQSTDNHVARISSYPVANVQTKYPNLNPLSRASSDPYQSVTDV